MRGNRQVFQIIRFVAAGCVVILALFNIALSRYVVPVPSSFDRVPTIPKASNRIIPTLVIQLRGELGNHLMAITHGMGVKWYAKEMFALDLQTELRHQVFTFGPNKEGTDSPKWKPTRDVVKKCFPNLRSWDFDRGTNWQEFEYSHKQQTQWLASLTKSRLDYINGRPWLLALTQRDPHAVEWHDLNTSLTTFMGLWNRTDRPKSKMNSWPFFTSQHPLVTIPFLYSHALENTLFVDRYFHEIRNLFRFDFGSCCGVESPHPDETVLHYRNFDAALSGSDSMLEDLSPEQTVNTLLKHLQAGDKVALTTRVHDDNLNRLVTALHNKGLQVRVVEGQSAAQDFCFLLKSQKELVGNFQSTFLFWAAILSQSVASIRWYTVDSPRVRDRCGGSMNVIKRRFLYNWTHPALKDRIHQFLIAPENNGTRI